MYLSSIQHGIQAGHAAVELMEKYPAACPTDDLDVRVELVHNWAKIHKTFVVLTPGGTQPMHALKAHLESSENPYPWSLFIEPDADDLLSSLCIILPEKMYEDEAKLFVSAYRSAERCGDKRPEPSALGFSEWEAQFLLLKSDARLAS